MAAAVASSGSVPVAPAAVVVPARAVQAPPPSCTALEPLAPLGAQGLPAGAAFGTSVAGDGTVAVIGAPYVDGGLAYVYTRVGGTWRPIAHLRGSDTQPGDFFGGAVAISGDTIVVGADLHGNSSGRVYVFTQGRQSWRQTAELSAHAPAGAGFGFSVAVAAGTIVASAIMPSGVAYVFTRDGQGWHGSARLSTRDNQGSSSFGFSVATTGGVVAVGDPGYMNGAGRVDMFSQGLGYWVQTAALTAEGARPGENFGFSVAASFDRVLVGAPGDIGGTAFVFTAAHHGWRQTAELTGTGTWPGDQFGYSVALSPDLAVVGAPWQSTGRTYLFSWTGDGWRQAAVMTGPAGGSSFGIALAASATSVIIGANGNLGGMGSAWSSTPMPPPSRVVTTVRSCHNAPRTQLTTGISRHRAGSSQS